MFSDCSLSGGRGEWESEHSGAGLAVCGIKGENALKIGRLKGAVGELEVHRYTLFNDCV